MANLLRSTPSTDDGSGGTSPTSPYLPPMPTTTGRYWQNPAAAVAPGANPFGPILARTAPGADTWGLSEHGNFRPLTPEELFSAQDYVDAFWRANPTGYDPSHPKDAVPPAYGGGSGGGSGSGGSHAGGSELDLSGIMGLFDDPATALYVDAIKKALTRLGGPLQIAGLDDYTGALRTRMGELASPLDEPPEISSYKTLLKSLSEASFTPNAELDAALKAIATRIGELNAPPFSALEEKGQEVKAFDALEQAKQQARAQVTERLAGHGIGAGSGILEAALEQSDRAFDQLRARNLNDLLLYRIETGQARKDKAIDLGGAAAGLRGAELARQDAFGDRRISAAGQAAQIAQSQQALGESRKDQVVNLASALADLGFNLENLTTARGTQELQVASLLPDLVERRLQLALATLSGGTPNLAPLGSQLMGLYNTAATNVRGSASPGTNWGQLIASLAPLFAGSGSSR